MDSAIRDAISAGAAGTPINRQNLLDVLTFLERRGASPAAMQLAMERAGIHPDVAQLISRCAPQPAPTRPDPATTSPRPASTAAHPGRTAQRALKAIARGGLLWILVLGAGLAAGLAVGYEIGVGEGFEAGLDRFALLLRAS